MQHYQSTQIRHIATYEPTKLRDVHNCLIAERMDMDKVMSKYLDANLWKMGENVNTEIWKKYKSLSKTYSQIVKSITLTEFYLKRTMQ